MAWNKFSNTAFIYVLVIFTSTLFLSSCTDNKADLRVSIKYEDSYVGAQLRDNAELKIGIQIVKEWETFELIKGESNHFYIKASNNLYVRFDSNNQRLEASSPQGLVLFEFQPVNKTSLTHIYLPTGNPVVVDSNGYLALGVKEAKPATFNILNIEQPNTYFNTSQLLFLIAGFLFLFIAIVVHEFYEIKINVALTFLIIGGVLIRIFAILLDNHLSLWDEQFHALVAKNLMAHPLKPTLIDIPLLEYHYQMWIDNHIWLHKQPLFLWQMALSMKMFGVNLIGLRLHLVVMSGILIPVIYRMGSLLTTKKTGFYASLFFIASNFAIEQASGYYNTDHNDVTFLFYVTMSIWSWLEYSYSSSKKRKLIFAILTGVFSGGAILTKWLVGLIVYAGWGIATISNSKTRKNIGAYLDMALAFTISVLIALPWQIYITRVFPEESSFEYDLNTKHFLTAIENHSGDWTYHFSNSELLYGVPFTLVLIALLTFWFNMKDKAVRWGIFTILSLVYLFFTLAATKMPAFVFILAPFVFIAFATFTNQFFSFLIINNKIKNALVYQKLYHVIIITSMLIYFIDINKIQDAHTSSKHKNDTIWEQEQLENRLIASLNSTIPNIEEHVLFNIKDLKNIPAMFFSNAVVAYGFIPTEMNISEITDKGYKIAVYDDGDLPYYILDDENIFLFNTVQVPSPTIFKPYL